MKHNFIFDEIFTALTTFGHPVFYVLLILVLLAFNVSFALPLFFALLGVEIICIIIKLTYRKDRPVIQTREGFYNKIDANSFPSIHSARIALIATTFIMHFQNLPLTIICAILMLGTGYSRMYLKKHFFIDVVVGFSIGILLAVTVFKLWM